ncbi:MAG: pilus assembly protein PilM [Minisyncoccia bacterium]
MILDKIFEVFPPPKFLDIPFAGISISDTVIHCIKFGKKGRALFVEKYAKSEVNPGLIKSGQIENKDEVAQILKSLKKEIGLDYVKISLPEERGYLFNAKIPVVKQNEIRSVIESKMEESVPVSPAELTFDYKVVRMNPSHLNVVVSTMPINVVDKYVSLAEDSGLSLLSLETESQATARALLSKDAPETVVIINFEKEKVGLYVASGLTVHFTSTLSFKGDVSSNLDFMSQEIKKLYTYWHTLKENVDNENRKIRQIIICGEGFDIDITQHFTVHNKIPTILGNVWVNAFNINTVVPEISFIDSLGYVTAIGLALPGDILI